MATAVIDAPAPVTEADQVAAYTPLVRKIAARYAGLLEFEDAVQVGTIGLLEAIRVYDAGCGIPFGTVAYKRISGRIVDEVRLRYGRERQRYGNTTTLSAFTHEQVEEMVGLQDEDIGDIVSSREMLKALLDVLPLQHRAVIILFYAQAIPIKEIANRWQISAGKVSQYRSEALRFMRSAHVD